MALDQETLDAIAAAVGTAVKTAVDPIAGRIKTDVEAFAGSWLAGQPKPEDPKPAKPDPEPAKDTALEAAQVRIAALEKAQEDAIKAAKDSAFESALGSLLDGHKVLHKPALMTYLKGQMTDFEQVGDKWLKDGKDLTEEVTAFLATDYGKHHLPSQHKSGTGTDKPGPAPNEPTQAELFAALL